MQLQQQELAKDSTRVHNTGELSTNTDVAVDPTKVEHNEYGDAAAAAAYKTPRNSSTFRKKKSRKRNKSRGSDANYSGMIWDVGETHQFLLS